MTKPTRTLAWSNAERERALTKLGTFAQKPEFDEIYELGLTLFWGGRLDALPEAERERLQDEESIVRLFHWLCFDMPLEEDGATIATDFLANPGVLLTAGERTWLERMAGASLRLYEVLEVRRDEGLSLKDCFTGDRIEVTERLATHQLSQWDLIAVRIIEGEHGHPVLEGAPYLFNPAEGPDLLQDFAAARKQRGKRDSELAFFKEAGFLFQHMWLDLMAAAAPPLLLTTDGDEFALHRVTFDIDDPAQVSKALRAHSAFEPDGYGGFAWRERAGAQRLLGAVTVTRKRCVLEVFSETRARRGRTLLEKLLGPSIRHRSTVVENVLKAAAKAGGQPPLPELSPEEHLQIVGEFLSNYYRAWLDEPVPALGNRTPRKAAKLKTQRPQLVALLKQIDGGMQRQQAAGQPAVDLTFLWTELGIDPE